MSKSKISVHKLWKSQDFLRWDKIFFHFFQSIDMVLTAIPGLGGLMWYRFKVGNGMFVLGPGLFFVMYMYANLVNFDVYLKVPVS